MTSVSARVGVGSSTETSSGSTTQVRSTLIDVLPLHRVELDHVARRDVLQSPEEAVAVTGDAQVSIRARLRRALDVPDGAVERAVVGARQHRHLESNLRDSEHGERMRRRFESRLLPGADTPLGAHRDWSGRGRSEREVLKLRETVKIVPRRSGHAHL